MASSTSSEYALPSNSSSVASVLTLKLDRTNYPLWLAQITPLLKSRGLMGFVKGTTTCPPSVVKDKDNTEKVNPAYDDWIRQDQLILSWINGSLSPSVLGPVARYTTSRDTWLSLEKRFASQTLHRIIHLRGELLRTTRGDSSISEFLDKINVSSAQARDSPITYEGLEALLLTAERRFQSQGLNLNEVTPTALVAGRGSGRGGGYRGGRNGGFRGGSSFSRGGGRFPSPQSSSSSTGGYNGHNRNFPHSNNRRFSSPSQTSGSSQPSGSSVVSGRVNCQICNRPGHTALDCYNRMNLAYEGRIPSPQLSAMAAHSYSPAASRTWLLDTGANAHITPDAGNLNDARDYHGSHVGGVVAGTGSQIGEDAFPRIE
ncbi:hypothetical protein ACE6H2_000261 [Prunus campanulata]